MRHLHIPLQAGDDEVLKRMRRKYTTAQYQEKIQTVRQVLPEFALTSDVIVGFPGETEEQFINTYHFIRELQFAELHVFPIHPGAEPLQPVCRIRCRPTSRREE